MNIYDMKNNIGFKTLRETAELTIVLDQHGVGPRPTSTISGAYSGIDWDADTLQLIPDKPLVSWEYLEYYIPNIRSLLEDARYQKTQETLAEMQKQRKELS